MSEDDEKRILKLELDHQSIRSDVAHVANTIQSNSKKLDALISGVSKLDTKTDITMSTLKFMQESHKELKSDYKGFRTKEYDKFKMDVHDRISKTNISMAKLIAVAGAAATMIYAIIETIKNFTNPPG